MSAQVPPVNIDEIATRNNMTREEVGEFLTIVKNGMLPEAKIIPVTENDERRYLTVERRGVGPIMTAYGTFWMYDFTIDDQWQKYTVIVKARLDNKTFTPIFDDPTRRMIPDEMPILLAGVGAQGGDYSDLKALLNTSGSGVFVNSSRGLLYPPNFTGAAWQEAVAKAVVDFKEALNNARR